MAEADAGFLTVEQREILDQAALTAGNAKDVGPVGALPGGGSGGGGGPRGRRRGDHATRNHPQVAPRHERRSHTGRSGRPRRDGHRGWGVLLDSGAAAALDRNDPNYDSEEEPYKLVGAPIHDSLEEFKAKVVSIVEEYFVSDDIAEAAADLAEIGLPSYHYHFVKRVVSLAMDRKDREREMASVLLSALYADVIEHDQVAKGFLRLLESIDDLSLDIPDAPELLSLFLARAVVDEILPPAFLNKASKMLLADAKGQGVLKNAESHLAGRHAAERVERCWGGALNQTAEEVKQKIIKLLEEYVNSGDKVEAFRRIRELNMPFFHHEVVKKALIMAMEKKHADRLILSLLHEAADTGLLTSSQIAKGFGRVSDAVEDLSLDIPQAPSFLQSYAAEATAAGWLSTPFGEVVINELHSPLVEVDHVREFKHKATDIIREYFSSDDAGEVARSLEEIGMPEFYDIFVKKLITMAMDRKNREKEMASVLLSSLYGELISMAQIGSGLKHVLESIDDLALDIPHAASELSLFVARAIVDDILPPLFLKKMKEELRDDTLGSEVVHMSEMILGARHAGERVLRCWGGGEGRTVDDAKDRIIKILEEFAAGGELREACECIRNLVLPFYNHEVVKKSLIMAMEKQNDRPLTLLSESCSQGLISTSQMAKGFSRVVDVLPDLALDIPDARQKLARYVKLAKADGWLSPSFEIEREAAKTPEMNGTPVAAPVTA
ncbi:hypothetical protein CBR_g226 [Chara braunii]|uniref:MI domain-containing protein n=1 Tax=Chara braunii TaxID=69332 RepID=A0A388JM58_CHABU|nr:hypothetical protein CBR_g226 [Chara braunii]|eukprot:GBG58825.1 hypothetical protein CBR_g226 [Chara braunii]